MRVCHLSPPAAAAPRRARRGTQRRAAPACASLFSQWITAAAESRDGFAAALASVVEGGLLGLQGSVWPSELCDAIRCSSLASAVNDLHLDERLAAFAASLPSGSAAAATAAGLDIAGTAFASTAAGGAAVLIAASLSQRRPAAPNSLSCLYDPDLASAYFGARPVEKLSRQTELLSVAAGFGLSLLLDELRGETAARAGERAACLRKLIVAQGAAFIKVGQAVAVRPDVLPPAYIEELAKLLDQVPPFEAVEAAAALRGALVLQGVGSPEAIFADMAAFNVPVAAASIGQVYRARLRADGREVAVKLQRPGILERVSLDLHLIRSGVAALAALPPGQPGGLRARLATQAAAIVEVLDLAATRFLEELDYTREAANSVRFGRLMASSPSVSGSIVVPAVVGDLSCRTVLVQEWIEGTRLADIDKATPAGRAQASSVVRTLLLSYMCQLLETGFLHADPHPGNFLLLKNGRLAVLDYGMMTTITQDQRIAFVEYMAHLSSKQYGETVDDLVNLGFLSGDCESVAVGADLLAFSLTLRPPCPPLAVAADPAKRAIIAPAIASTLEIIYGSGGGLSPGKVDALRQQSKVSALSDELKEISRKYPIRLPPYFLLILRAFGTLEGLGLGIDGDFQILHECFPFVARRMLTDDSPRIRAALRTFAYGSAGNRLSLERVEMLAEGVASFTATMDPSARLGQASQLALPPGVAGGAPAPAATAAAPLDAASLELLTVLLSPNGNYVQQLVIDEAVRAVDALSREAALALLAVGPLRALVAPLPALPFWGGGGGPLLRLSAEDEDALAALRRLATLVAPPRGAAPPDTRAIADVGAKLAPHWDSLAPGAARMGERFATALAARLQARAAEDFDAALRQFGLLQAVVPSSR